MFRTRYRQEIVAEFLPPSRPHKAQKLIILCDGMPSIPRKQPLSEFLARRAFGSFIPAIAEHGKAAGTFWRSRPMKTSSTSLTICQRKSKKLGSVGDSDCRRIKSSSSEEASGVRQQFSHPLTHE